jgi:hypothetical protein
MAEGRAQAVECLPNRCEDLTSNHSTEKKNAGQHNKLQEGKSNPPQRSNVK